MLTTLGVTFFTIGAKLVVDLTFCASGASSMRRLGGGFGVFPGAANTFPAKGPQGSISSATAIAPSAVRRGYFFIYLVTSASNRTHYLKPIFH
jgi:hypothetical protein